MRACGRIWGCAKGLRLGRRRLTAALIGARPSADQDKDSAPSRARRDRGGRYEGRYRLRRLLCPVDPSTVCSDPQGTREVDDEKCGVVKAETWACVGNVCLGGDWDGWHRGAPRPRAGVDEECSSSGYFSRREASHSSEQLRRRLNRHPTRRRRNEACMDAAFNARSIPGPHALEADVERWQFRGRFPLAVGSDAGYGWQVPIAWSWP